MDQAVVKGRVGQGRAGQGREGKGREGKGREGEGKGRGREGKGQRDRGTDRQNYVEQLEIGSSFHDHKTVTSNDRSWSLYIHSARRMQTGRELGWQN